MQDKCGPDVFSGTTSIEASNVRSDIGPQLYGHI